MTADTVDADMNESSEIMKPGPGNQRCAPPATSLTTNDYRVPGGGMGWGDGQAMTPAGMRPLPRVRQQAHSGALQQGVQEPLHVRS